MFPYIVSTEWQLGGLRLAPFPALIAVAIAVGYLIAVRRARHSGISGEHFTKLGVCVIAAALVGGHLAKYFYSPGAWRMVTIQPLVLLNIFHGAASFGGFIGGYLAAQAFLWKNSISYADRFLYADEAGFAIPFAWWIGRLGCYLVHDHPGIRTTSLLGVRYPGGTRYDLGLLEMLFLLALSAAFLILDRKPRPRGFFYVAFAFLYGLFRLGLDRLHVDPPRYYGWTVDQIAASLMILVAVVSVIILWQLKRVGADTAVASEVTCSRDPVNS